MAAPTAWLSVTQLILWQWRLSHSRQSAFRFTLLLQGIRRSARDLMLVSLTDHNLSHNTCRPVLISHFKYPLNTKCIQSVVEFNLVRQISLIANYNTFQS